MRLWCASRAFQHLDWKLGWWAVEGRNLGQACDHHREVLSPTMKLASRQQGRHERFHLPCTGHGVNKLRRSRRYGRMTW